MLAITLKIFVVVFIFNIYIIKECSSQPIFYDFWKTFENDMQNKQESNKSFDFFEALFGDLFDYSDEDYSKEPERYLVCKNCTVLLNKEQEVVPPPINTMESTQLVSALTQALQMFAEMNKMPTMPKPEESNVETSNAAEAQKPPAESMPTDIVAPP